MNIKLLNNSKPNNIIVYDLSGKKIMNFKYEKDIDVSMLGAGIYFLTIEIDNENIIKKFIKL
jgi:hypothetical protein